MDNGFDVFGNILEVKVKNMVNDSRYVIEYFICLLFFIGKMKMVEFRKSSIVIGVKMVKIKYEYCFFSLMEYLSFVYIFCWGIDDGMIYCIFVLVFMIFYILLWENKFRLMFFVFCLNLMELFE